MHDGLCPPTDSRRGTPPIGSFATGHNTTDKKETRNVQQERQQRTRQRDGQRPRPGQRQRAQARRRNRQRARAALGRALARRQPGARTAPRPGAGLPAQGPRRAQLRLPRRPRRHRAGQPHLRLRRLGLRVGRRRDAAPDRDGRHPDRRGEGRAPPTAPRCGSPSRARCPAPTSASTRWPRTPWTATTRPSRAR